MAGKPEIYRKPTIFDFQRNLDAIIYNDEQEAKTATQKIQAELAAKGLARSGAMIKALVGNADKIHAEVLNRCMNLIDEFIKSGSQLSHKALVETTRQRLESLAVILLTTVPDAGSPKVAQQVRTTYAEVFQQRLNTALGDIEIGFIDGRRLSAVQNAEGEKVLDDMLEDRVTLVKKDGTVQREDVPSLVMKGKIQIHDVTLPIEVGDHLLRKLPNGLVEDYIVDDPVLNSGLGQKFFSVHVHRSNAPTTQQAAAVQYILNGSHSRVNVSSTDNSINISGEIGIYPDSAETRKTPLRISSASTLIFP